jgi:hypothetical protein
MREPLSGRQGSVSQSGPDAAPTDPVHDPADSHGQRVLGGALLLIPRSTLWGCSHDQCQIPYRYFIDLPTGTVSRISIRVNNPFGGCRWYPRGTRGPALWYGRLGPW